MLCEVKTVIVCAKTYSNRDLIVIRECLEQSFDSKLCRLAIYLFFTQYAVAVANARTKRITAKTIIALTTVD